jgi:cell division protein FtsL
MRPAITLIFGLLSCAVLSANAVVFLTYLMTVLIKRIIAQIADRQSSESMPNALISSIDLLFIDYFKLSYFS